MQEEKEQAGLEAEAEEPELEEAAEEAEEAEPEVPEEADAEPEPDVPEEAEAEAEPEPDVPKEADAEPEPDAPKEAEAEAEPEPADKNRPGFVETVFGGIKRLTLKQAERALLIGGVVVIVALCIVPALAFQNIAPGNSAGSVGGADATAPAAIQHAEGEYEENDSFAIALMTGEYSGTVLEKTDDAGVGYVEETLFIGDSNTAGMINYGATTNVTMKNGIGIVSMGISHVTSLNCVKFSGMSAVPVPEAVRILQPRRILIEYGTNDYYMTPEKFAESYKTALEAIEAAYPWSDIIIGSIFPITSNCSYYTVSMPVIEKFNLELVKLAQEKDVHFLNWSEALKDPATGYCKPEYMAGDGVHLSKKGHEEIFSYLRTHKLDSDDKRPKPLNPIPAREPTPFGLLGVGLNTSSDDPVSPLEEEPKEEKKPAEKPPEETPPEDEKPVDPPPVDPPPVDPPPVDPPPVDPPPDKKCPDCGEDPCICGDPGEPDPPGDPPGDP